MRYLLIVMSLLLATAVLAEATEVELTDAEIADEPWSPRATLEDNTLVVFASFYDDLEVVDGLLIAVGSVTANTDNPNMAQARAMAEKAARLKARSVMEEFFLSLGFSKTDAATNAGYATVYGETVYNSDATVELRLSIPLEGDGGFMTALEATSLIVR